MEKLYDVIAVNLDNSRVRLISEGKTEKNAEAIIEMAVIRRGVEEEFFTKVATKTYQEGDTYGKTSKTRRENC